VVQCDYQQQHNRHPDAARRRRPRAVGLADAVNGYGDTLLYERGMIVINLPLAELKQRCHINERARSADKAADFSRRIRIGVPGTEL
jgi:hypothetical protein